MSRAKRTRRECSKHDDVPTIPVILALLVAPLVSFVTITAIAVAMWLFVVVPLCLFAFVVCSLLGAVLFLTSVFFEESPEQQAKQMEEDEVDEEEDDDDEEWESEGDQQEQEEEEEELGAWGSRSREDFEERGGWGSQWQEDLKEGHEQVVVAWNSLKASLDEMRAEVMAELHNL